MTRPDADQVAAIAEVGERYEVRIRNQVQSINRILLGAKYDDEMATLHEQLATVTVERDDALREIKRLSVSQQEPSTDTA